MLNGTKSPLVLEGGVTLTNRDGDMVWHAGDMLFAGGSTLESVGSEATLELKIERGAGYMMRPHEAWRSFDVTSRARLNSEVTEN